MARYLIVANQTLGSDQLMERVRECMQAGECTFHIVVPGTHPKDMSFYTEGASHAVAQQRLDAALERMRAIDATVDGEVGDPSPMLAIRDALLADQYDGIIVCTLPPGVSRWLKQDLPSRLERAFDGPITHVISEVESIS